MIALVLAATALSIYLITRSGKAAPMTDAETYGFVSIPIPDTVRPEPATDAERKALKPFDRVVTFVQRPGRPKLAANMVVDLVLGDTVNGSFATPYAWGKGWTADEPIPAVGEKFSFPKSFVFYVYSEGEKLVTEPMKAAGSSGETKI